LLYKTLEDEYINHLATKLRGTTQTYHPKFAQ